MARRIILKRLAYNLALSLGLAAAAPLLAPRLAQPRFRRLARVRLGLGTAWLPPRQEPGGIWLHALSVGEVGSAFPLLKALGERYPQRPLFFSVATDQGYTVARQILDGDPRVTLFVRPLDLPWAVERLLDRLNPGVFCLVEGDIWPNWQWAMEKRGVPCLLVNGRVSPRTFKGYHRLGPLARGLFSGFDRILVQSGVDLDRLRSVGVEPGKLAVGGNLKFDSAPAEMRPEARDELARELGLAGRRVLVAGSTHPGEDEPCMRAYAACRRDIPGLALVLAPRDIHRGAELAAMARELGLESARVSEAGDAQGVDVLILDVLGKLAQVYSLAEVAFVGGSLAPVGGHNLLEPAAQSVPVVFGPHTHNFLEMARRLEEEEGGQRVPDSTALAKAWRSLLFDPLKAGEMGRRARRFCLVHRGAVAKAVEEVSALLER